MRIGYACINLSLKCRSSRTFRLANFTAERFLETARANLACQKEIFEWNKKNGIDFFRLTSGLIPFASHPVCGKINWPKIFKKDFEELGDIVKKNGWRVSMHPGQYTILNSPDERVAKGAIEDFEYHRKVLDAMGLDMSHKILTHVGGVYNEKEKSLERFARRWGTLPEKIKSRLVIENDEKSFGIEDCLRLNKKIGIPVVFDIFHHDIYQKNGNNDWNICEIFEEVFKTWKKTDGAPIMHYSSQDKNKRSGAHASSLDAPHFKKFLDIIESCRAKISPDVMMEIKDKEKSALAAKRILAEAQVGAGQE